MAHRAGDSRPGPRSIRHKVLLAAGVLLVAVLGVPAATVAYLTSGPQAGGFATGSDERPRLPKPRPETAIPGVAFDALITSLRGITGAPHAPDGALVQDGGFDEAVSSGGDVVLMVTARAAREWGAYSGSCHYRSHAPPLSVTPAMVDVVHACTRAALPDEQEEAAIAWLRADRTATEVAKFGTVWVTAYRGPAVFGALVSA